ncbi:phenylacetate--CoA ligase family protein [Pareuzebyella sediminis]|uniref:phenylacetate--CoA ligase family protein n=1 Tax=Pareuzebyella sediminis TaxID=2607998 RepID=UPI0011EBF762|nr:phenylacetate--CoA ligase family protein [Pareuzebyella sediminis]
MEKPTTWSFKKLVFDIKTKILRPGIFKSHLKAKQDLRYKKIDKLNFKRRKRIVKHAYKNTSYYHKKYEALGSDFRIRSEKDFLKLPPVTRDDLANNFERLKVKNANSRNSRKVSSSGSTGRPISVLHDMRFPYTVLQWRILSWWGVRPYQNQAYIYRYKRPFFKKISNTWLWWPTKRIFLSGAEMDLKSVNKFVKKINRLKPELLQGYVDVVYEFALFLMDNDLRIHPPKMVWVTSAPLFENQRKVMEKVFGAPVCDQYGNTEVFTIAAECPRQNGLHIMHDSVHVEVVDNDNNPVPKGIIGKILITDLRNKIFPLIRYEIGDRGKLLKTTCGCNIPLPLMENVRGRQSVMLRTPSGLTIRGEHLTILFEKYLHNIREIQLIQKEDYSVDFCYVSKPKTDEKKEVELILGHLKTKTRNEIIIQPKCVDVVEKKGQKKPLIISHLK